MRGGGDSCAYMNLPLVLFRRHCLRPVRPYTLRIYFLVGISIKRRFSVLWGVDPHAPQYQAGFGHNRGTAMDDIYISACQENVLPSFLKLVKSYSLCDYFLPGTKTNQQRCSFLQCTITPPSTNMGCKLVLSCSLGCETALRNL